jgi:hypothetical protein
MTNSIDASRRFLPFGNTTGPRPDATQDTLRMRLQYRAV